MVSFKNGVLIFQMSPRIKVMTIRSNDLLINRAAVEEVSDTINRLKSLKTVRSR